MRMRLLGLLVLGAAIPLVVEGQGAPPGGPPVVPPATAPATPQPQRPVRRTLDIRAQAPAPEVVTIRPREIPQFSRTLLIPVVYPPPPGGATADSADTSRRTMIIFPGTLPVSGTAPPAGTGVTPPSSDSASRNRP